MNTRATKSAACLALLLGLAGVLPAQAADAPPPPESAAAKELRENLLLPGVTLAEGISEVTGVAISPLLGVSALGAWKYWSTEEALRSRLPWYCHPYVWGAGFALLGICFLKDSLGAAAPMVVKKPLDFIELFEDKASALVASTAFVPVVAMAVSQYQRIQDSEQALSSITGSGLAMVPTLGAAGALLENFWITIPLGIVAFAVVWLSSHALNVLIALSPFRLIDAGLKLSKLALISLLAAATFLSPYLGAFLSLILIVIGALAAGWSFRLTVFGTLMGRDILLNKRATADHIRSHGAKAFLSRRTDGIPVRTYGKVTPAPDGGVTFGYRPWIIFPERRVTLPGDGLVLCKGLLYSSLAHRRDSDTRLRRSVILLPRYRRIEDALAARLGCAEVLDSALLRGFKAMRMWLRMETRGGARLELGPLAN